MEQIQVVGYARISTVNQKEGYSLEGQRLAITEYCQTNNFNLVAIYEDVMSGTKVNDDDDDDNISVNRDGLQSMLSSLKDSDIKFVVVLTTSRLWRSDMVRCLISRTLIRYKIDVKAIDRSNFSIYNNADPSAFLINAILSALDAYEVLEINKKLSRGRVSKAKLGGYSGGQATYGFASRRGSKVLEINPLEASIVQKVFALKRAAIKVTLQSICNTLNAEGLTTRQGKQFFPPHIKNILDHEAFYKGTYSYSGITSQGQHPTINIQ